MGYRSAKTLGYIFGQQVAMVAEEFFLDTLPRLPIFNSKECMWRLVFRGEDQSHVESVARPGSQVYLGDREILDAQHVERRTGIGINIAEPWPGEFVRRGPCGENALAGISHRQEAAGLGMHHDVIAIG